MKFYVDSCIWIDYFEDRKDNFRPLGEFAFQFLKKCVEKKHTILVSTFVIEELLDFCSFERINSFFSTFEKAIEKIDYSSEEFTEARSFWIKSGKKFPLQDVLHSIIARNNNAILVSRDKHFNEIGLVEFELPENLNI